MYNMFLVFLAVIPGIYLLIKVYKLDHVEKEPKGLLALLLLFGMLSVIPTVLVEMLAEAFLLIFFDEGSVIFNLLEYFLGVALVEEFFKYLAMRIPTWKHKAFNYRFDAVVYAVAATIGFAVVENIMYCIDGGISTALMRMILGVPGHVIYAIFMGYYYGLAKKYHTLGWKKKSKRYRRLAIWVPVLIHGFDDFCLMSENVWLLLLYFGYLIILYIFAFTFEKRMAKNDERITFRLIPYHKEATMKLNEEGLKARKDWEDKGYKLPIYNREAMVQRTMAEPVWVHFGAGNIFRAFQANVVQNLLNAGAINKGIIVVEGFDYEIIEKKYRPNDNYSILVTLKSNGSIEKTVVGSIAESCILDSDNIPEYSRLKTIFEADSLQMVTFTITEKGYSLVDANGVILGSVKADFENGPEKPQSYMGKVTALLYHRYLSGKKPVAMVSNDNCSHNGDKLYAAVAGFAKAWAENGLIDKGFLEYIDDRSLVTFPWTMIDKITPRPDASVEEMLKKDNLEELEPVITSKNTYVAPFVNAEETEYLVMEDAFPNGRQALEKGGIIFTDRETVDKVERMKVCTCLNPLHTALAVYGCLLGYDRISAEMKDTELVKLVQTIGYKEGLPVVTDPGVINPKDFIDTVLNVRVPNPFMPDTPQRIATDTSQKLSIRFGQTIKNYISRGLDISDLKLIPLVFAGWLRYLMAIDDKGEAFELSPDPLLTKVCPCVADISLGANDKAYIESKVSELLHDETIFGVDLYEAGLADLVITYFVELTAGVGAIRETLKKYTA